MTVAELKCYSRLRDLTMTGKKSELVARVLASSENKLPIKKAAEEVESQLLDEYQAKLLLDETLIPDPNYNGFKLQSASHVRQYHQHD